MAAIPVPAADCDPAAKPQKRERYYRPELDVVRFFAFFFVFLHHTIHHDPAGFGPHFRWANQAAAFSNACGFGLGLFFALSAYLIVELLLREKERSSTIDIRSFYIRRVLRIWPLYFFGLAIGCTLALRSHHYEDLALFGAYALMLGNWFNVFIHFTINPMGVLWSISIEEQFYLFCPLAVRQLTRRGLYALSAAILLIANISLFYLGNRHADSNITVWCNGLVQFEFFAVGMLICLVLRGRLPRIPVPVRLSMCCSAILLWFLACYSFHAKQLELSTTGQDLMTGYALASIGCALIIVGFLDFPAKLLPGWMVWLGKVSFGLYVYHALAIDLISELSNIFPAKGMLAFIVRMAAKMALTILLAGLSYRYFESRFLRLKKRFETVESRPV